MITYPVDYENTRWATWSISQNAIIHHNRRWPRIDGGEIIGLSADIVPLLEVTEDQPAYDPTTHYLIRSEPIVDVVNNTHTHDWIITARPQEDLDEEAENEIAKSHYNDLIAGIGTAEERIVRVEKVAAHLLKRTYDL